MAGPAHHDRANKTARKLGDKRRALGQAPGCRRIVLVDGGVVQPRVAQRTVRGVKQPRERAYVVIRPRLPDQPRHARTVPGSPPARPVNSALAPLPMDQSHIRNFCIIAHIDHGKSTLADRILEHCGAVRGIAQEQMLDTMELERERGITIKMTAVRMEYTAKDGQTYELNLIDTPGHVDFTYEVSRALFACEGALLLVDATQGVEAQTIANANMAMTQNLEIIPVVNKMDLPHADLHMAQEEIENALLIDASEAIPCSAKSGMGIPDILEAVVQRVPAPKGDATKPLRALIFDSHFDSYQGAVAYVRVVDGSVKPGDKIKMMSTGQTFDVDEVGVFRPRLERGLRLDTGEVGFVTAAIKNIGEASVGDTVTWAEPAAEVALPGYRKAQPMVYCGLYPTDSDQYEAFATRSSNSNSTPRAWSSSRKPPMRLASASAAAFSACSTWTSSASGWSGS